jgi:hypothetical protein
MKTSLTKTSQQCGRLASGFGKSSIAGTLNAFVLNLDFGKTARATLHGFAEKSHFFAETR